VVTSSDVVIVGAGPAGAASAILLARSGLDVVLIDRHEFPRPKPCGDCLSPNASRWLDRLGVLETVNELRPARLHGWNIVAPGGAAFQARFDEMTRDPLVATALAVSRSRLDAVLVAEARRSGVRLITGVRITDVMPDVQGVRGTDAAGEPFAVGARLVVAADGLRSVIARRLDLVSRAPRVRKLSLTAHATGVLMDSAFGEMHLADGMCVGLAPVTAGDDAVFNVTLVVDADRAGRAVASDPMSFFRQSLDRFSGLAGRIRDIAFVPTEAGEGREPRLLASGPFDVPVRRVTIPGLALVGDAAGYFDPFTGQGIHSALEGAHLLARHAIPELLRTPHSRPRLGSFANELRGKIRQRHLVQRMIEAVVSRPRLSDRMIPRLARRPAAGRALLATTGDLAPARSLFSPGFMLALAGPPALEAHRS